MTPSKETHCQAFLFISSYHRIHRLFSYGKDFQHSGCQQRLLEISWNKRTNKKAFVCHAVLNQYNCMQIGLTNAQTRSQRARDLLLPYFKLETCLVYFYDVVGKSVKNSFSVFKKPQTFYEKQMCRYKSPNVGFSKHWTNTLTTSLSLSSLKSIFVLLRRWKRFCSSLQAIHTLTSWSVQFQLTLRLQFQPHFRPASLDARKRVPCRFCKHLTWTTSRAHITHDSVDRRVDSASAPAASAVLNWHGCHGLMDRLRYVPNKCGEYSLPHRLLPWNPSSSRTKFS